MIAHCAQLAWAVGAVVFVVIAAWGLGGCLPRWLRDDSGLLDSECAALRFLGGAGLLGLVTFLIGQFYFSVWSSVAILTGASLLNFRFPWPGRRWLTWG